MGADVAKAAFEAAQFADPVADVCQPRIGDLLEIGAAGGFLPPLREKTAGLLTLKPRSRSRRMNSNCRAWFSL
jgi:hypothetical protein